jgi:hypothetical protein
MSVPTRQASMELRDTTHDRFVAHVDILGMSSIVERDYDEAWQMLTALVTARDDATNSTLDFIDRAERIHVPERVRSVTFSDTIVLFTREATDIDLRALIVTVMQLFASALYNRVPVRAGIALGPFYFNIDRSMYMGPALIEAYRIGESAQWLGVVFAPSLQGREKQIGLTSGSSPLIVEWSVPFKEGSRLMSVANWPAAMGKNFKVVPPLTVDQFYEIFEPTFGSLASLPPEVKAKYRHTVAFMNEQYSAHAGLQQTR